MSKQRSWAAKPAPALRPEVASSVTAPIAGQVSLTRRFGALLIDWMLCLLISGFFVADRLRAGWVPPVILVVEYTFFIGLFAQTPGMFVARIRCVSINDGGRIGIIYAAVRGFLLCLVVPALVMDSTQRGWHDRVAGSVMVPRTA